MTLSLLLAAIHFVTLDPGHFHAALVQKSAYDEVAPEVAVFAPAGGELKSHLALIDSFNTRKDSPTGWKEQVYTGDDYLPAFVAAARSGKLGADPVVILAGKNDRKGDYALAAIKNGVSVLADKPMAITPEVYAKTERAARLARQKGLYFADIMTQRNEITCILQKALAAEKTLFGELEKGTPEEPAIVMESVHHFCKLVNGSPLKRPAWYYDTAVQGEGLVDVTTHLVDTLQWSAFDHVRLSTNDVEMLAAKVWPTMISPKEYRLSTGELTLKTFACFANGEFVWKLKGVTCRVAVRWDFMASEGSGDTHTSVMRGTKAEVLIRQGEKEGFKPVVYVRSRGEAAETQKALDVALRHIAETWPGVAAVKEETDLWRITYPAVYDVGHEAHFSVVVREYLKWMKEGKEDPLYIDNMLVKYHTLVEAWKKAHAK